MKWRPDWIYLTKQGSSLLAARMREEDGMVLKVYRGVA